MSYALGQVSNAPPVQVGEGAKQDPVLGAASVLASGILREVASLPPGRRRAALVTKLNRLHPGLGQKFLSESRAIKRRGVPSDQATFDGLRLALANRLAEHFEDIARKSGGTGPLQGMGAISLRNVSCTLLAAGTTGATIGTAFKNPSASETVMAAGSTGSSIAGCDRKQLEAQARIAEANAQQAQAQAAAASAAQAGKKDRTMMYVALGGGALVLLLGGALILRK